VNPAYLKMFGYDSLEEINAKSTLDFVAPGERERIGGYIQQRVRGEAAPTIYETRGLRRDAFEFDMEVRVSSYQMDGELYAVAFLRDISERKQAEQAVRRVQEQLQDMFDNTPAAVYAKDLQGRYIFVNREWAERSRRRPEEAIGKTTAALFPDYGRDQYNEPWDPQEQQAIQSGEVLQHEQVGGTTGRVYLATKFLLRDANGAPYALCNSSLDITERKQAEQALQRYTERLQILHEIDRAILSAETPEKIASAALQHIRRLIPVQRVNVWVIDDQTNERVLLASIDDKAVQTVGERHPFESEWSEFLFQGETLVIHDLRDFPPSLPLFSTLLKQGFLTAVVIPMTVQSQIIGALSLVADRPHVCSDEDIQVAREIANQLAVAIRQARLLEAERDQRTLAEALRDSAAAASRTLALDAVLDHILSNVERVVPHDACNIMLIEGGTARVVRARGWAERGLGEWIATVSFEPVEIDRWRQWFAAEHPQPYIINDTHADPLWEMSAESEWIHSTIKAPIHIGGELIGLLNLDGATRDFFTQQHLDRLQAFADQAAVAIRNARLYEAEQQRRRIAETLVRSANILNSTLDPDQVLDLILHQLAGVIEFDSGTVQQAGEDRMVITACQGFEHPEHILGFALPLDPQRPNWRVMTEKKPVLVVDVAESYPNFVVPDPDDAKGTRTWLGLPLLSRERVIGMLTLDRAEVRPFTQDDIDLGMAFANQAAAAIENARLYAQVQRHAVELEQRVIERTAALEVANEELRVLSRMKDQFVSNVSHELRTPITSMLLQIHLAARAGAGIQQNRLEALRREARRLEDLIESLLFLSRLDQDRVTITFKDIDLNSLIGDLVLDRQVLSEQQGLRLSFVPLADCPTVTGDPRLIGQVLSILLTNAINYTPQGGQIEVATLCENGWAGFRVSDTGLGIPADEREQLFSRFFRGKVGRDSGESGTGLGLAIAKEIVDRHDGRIEIESDGVPGRGTTFKVWLPSGREIR
jgi:PAS domain S-box-containing protein